MRFAIILIAAAVITAAVIICIIWRICMRKFIPTEDKKEQQKQLNATLKPSGFAYDAKEDYFYSLMDCWQREAGYCRLYDEGSPFFNMIMDCEPILFSYGGKRWMIELWKGQYGITTGAEIGVYSTDREDIISERFTGTFYETISDAERLPMSFVLRKNGKVLLRRNGLHWWLTAFKLGEFSHTDTLEMEAKITFPNDQMRDAFVGGLQEVGYTEKEYKISHDTVTVQYDKPHTRQPITQDGIQETIVQQINDNNCKLFAFATAPYTDTMDKLEYLMDAVPALFEFFLNSLYGHGFFAAFDWLKDLLDGDRPQSTSLSPAPATPPTPSVPPVLPVPATPPVPPVPPVPPAPSSLLPCRPKRSCPKLRVYSDRRCSGCSCDCPVVSTIWSADADKVERFVLESPCAVQNSDKGHDDNADR